MSPADAKDILIANLKLRIEALRRALYGIAQSPHCHDVTRPSQTPCPACTAERALKMDGTA